MTCHNQFAKQTGITPQIGVFSSIVGIGDGVCVVNPTELRLCQSRLRPSSKLMTS